MLAPGSVGILYALEVPRIRAVFGLKTWFDAADRGSLRTMATAEHEIVYDIATRDELRGELEKLARERLGMSADDFLEQWKAGDLDEFSPTVSRVALLARLITD